VPPRRGIRRIALALLVILGGCASPATVAPTAPATPTAPPVPVLRVGEAFTADLFGNGKATITVADMEISGRSIPDDPPVAGDTVHLVVTIKILLDRAGDPLAGGPGNFRFRDSAATVHTARTSNAAFPPELAQVNLVTAGQQAQGRVFFDVPRESVGGGHIQLMTGRLVHAVWRV
jgi:hypothetical protein